jgi:hypothetical protein
MSASGIFLSKLKSDSVLAVASLFLIVLFVFLSISWIRPPATVPADAPAADFSSGRAKQRLQVIAREPHPTGSNENARVREYIQNELVALGLNPEVQEAEAFGQPRGAFIRAAMVRNVIARLRGTDSSKAILLAAHYDSVSTGPGAGDDGAGVVTLLETLRALKAGPPLKNDVVFLFTDGEELGLLGATAFVDNYPQLRDIGLALNFEARGNRGPSFMFETSDENGGLVAALARAAPRPIANSLMYSLYKTLPNDTDLTVIKRGGVPGFNFAFADGLNHYHTQLDNVEELDERSLQHHGSYALALTRHFGNLDLRETKAPDAVYFNLFGVGLIHYSRSWVIPFTILVTLLFIGVVAVGIKGKHLSISGLALGLLPTLASMLGVVLVSFFVLKLISELHRGYEWIPYTDPYNGWLYKIGFVLLTVAVTSGVYLFFRRKAGLPNLIIGGMCWWLLLLLLFTVFVPGGSYLFTWPLLFNLVGAGILFLSGEQKLTSAKRFFVNFLCAIPSLVLIAQIVYMLFIMLGLHSLWVTLLPVVLLLTLLVPHLDLMTLRKRWLLPIASVAIGFGFIVAGLLTSGFDVSRRHADSLFYVFNADTGRAMWASLDARADEWTSHFLSEDAQPQTLNNLLPWLTQEALQGDAPPVSAPAPNLEVLDNSNNGGARILRMRLVSPRQAPALIIFADQKTEVVGAVINGKRVEKGKGDANAQDGVNWGVIYFAPPKEGIELTLELKPSQQPPIFQVQDLSYELPQIPGSSFAARPNYMMPAPIRGGSDTTILVKSYTIEGRP